MLVFNPQQVNTNFIYALDQYIMRGGNLILLIDPYAEAVAQKYPYTKQNRNLLLPLLQKWGLKMDENTIVADTNLSRPSYQTALSEPENPTYLNLSAQNMQLLPEMGNPWPRLTLHSGGALKIEHPQSNVTYTPLLFTTDQAQTLDADIVKHSSVQDMYNALSEAKSRHNLAYWRGQNYLGIGPAAHGRIKTTDKIYASTHHRQLEELTPQERAEELIIMGLRIREGINKENFRRQCGLELTGFVNDKARQSLIRQKLLFEDKHSLRAANRGFLLLNKIIEELCR